MATIPMSPDVPGQPCDPVHLEEWRARADRVWRQTEPEHLRAEDALVLGTVAVPRLLADRAELLALLREVDRVLEWYGDNCEAHTFGPEGDCGTCVNPGLRARLAAVLR